VLPSEILVTVTFIVYWWITFYNTDGVILTRIVLKTKSNSEFSDYRTCSQVDM